VEYGNRFFSKSLLKALREGRLEGVKTKLSNGLALTLTSDGKALW
jgi:hypothetical protein